MTKPVEVIGLRKQYGNVIAVDNVSFTIEEGQVFGLLGPNGAGKTTTVEMIVGLRKPDGGTIRIAGIEVPKEIDKVKEIIGVQLQATTIWDRIKVGEAVSLFGSYYRKAIPCDRILEEVALTDKRDSYVETLSGGQVQRLALALVLVNDPQVLFLDEPTTGLDPQARRNLWDIVTGLKQRGKTIILTTHYMEEAEHLCDRVAIIDYGRIIADDAPRRLIDKLDLESAVEFVSSSEKVAPALEEISGVSRVQREATTYTLFTRATQAVMKDLIFMAEQRGFELDSMSVRRATLEDVFLSLTGRKLRE